MDIDPENPPTGHHIPAALLTALNAHANKELGASQAYLAMSYFFEDLNFSGIAEYFRAQADEERGHGLKIFEFIVKRGDRVAVEALAAPKAEYANASDAFASAFALEVATTKSIHDLMRLSRAGDTADLPTEQFLKFYVDEQVNAEDEARKNWEEAKAYERVPGLYYHLDRFMHKRAKKVGGDD